MDPSALCDTTPTNPVAFKEIWKNEYPAHPSVWYQVSKIKINAADAIKEACILEDPTVASGDIQKFPVLIKQYYPEFRKE